MGEYPILLSARLSAIAESLPENALICDVGSDHGALPLFLLKSKRSPRVIVTDVNPLPLERAKKCLEEAGVDHLADFILGDGLDKTFSFDVDVYVIAGMGGENIAGILDRALTKIPYGTSFVLQPMTRVCSLRRYLYEHGFEIAREKVVWEHQKFFPILWATYDGVQRPEKTELSFLGEFLPKEKSEANKAYFLHLLNQWEIKIKGKKSAGVSCEKDMAQRDLLLSILKEYL